MFARLASPGYGQRGRARGPVLLGLCI